MLHAEEPRDPVSIHDPLWSLDLSEVSVPLCRAFIERIPKVELHSHLEGALTPETLLDVAEAHGISLPAATVDELRPFVQVNDADATLVDFLKKFETIGPVFVSTEVIEDLARQTALLAAAEGTRYLELRFSPVYMAAAHGLDPDEVVKAVAAGVAAAEAESGLVTKLILIVERQLGLDSAWEVLKLAEAHHNLGVVAIDLANDEFNFPPGPYAPVFRKARTSGLRVTIHAGEAGPAENVRVALEDLGAERIGHGVRAVEDPVVLAMLEARETPMEVCVTSNVQTGAVASLDVHPIAELLRRGFLVTLNTDDAGVCGVNLTDELVKTSRTFKLLVEEVYRLQDNAARAAFLPDAEKMKLRAEVVAGFLDALGWLRRELALPPSNRDL